MATIQSTNSFAAQNAFHGTGFEELTAFVTDNAEEIIQIAREAGGHNAAAAASDLADTVMSGEAEVEMVHDLLVVVRDFLSRASCRIGAVRGTHRPDLDAAVRWYGARLDELIADLW